MKNRLVRINIARLLSGEYFWYMKIENAHIESYGMKSRRGAKRSAKAFAYRYDIPNYKFIDV